MRYVLVFVSVVHGFCHLPGYTAGGTRLPRLVWLVLAALFAALAVGIGLRAPWWLRLLPLLALASFVCCLWSLPEARWGLAANALLVGLAAAAVRWPGDVPAVGNAAVESLWSEARAAPLEVFDPARLRAGADVVGRSIAAGTPLAQAVRLRMRGEIRIGAAWHPFRAEQVITARRGMVWAGTVSLFGLPVLGADRVIDGAGLLSWKLFDLFSVAYGEGADLSRSATGRYLAEAAVWLPSVLCATNRIEWLPGGLAPAQFGVRLRSFGETVDLHGGPDGLSFPRWGNPDGGPFRYLPFGVTVEQTRAFAGYTIPSRIRAGWYHGTDRFASEGEFFRATIEGATFK